MGRSQRIIAALATLAALGTSVAHAAPRSAITLVGTPAFGAEVTFDITTTLAEPYVWNACYQGGERVYSETHAFFDDPERWDQSRMFTLGPTNDWTGGAASCEAQLVRLAPGGFHRLASVSYDVP